MNIRKTSTPMDIAVTSLQANAQRLKVAANNIANARTTSADHKPYARKRVEVWAHDDELSGISRAKILSDRTGRTRPVFDPSHPHADEKGFVHYPDVEVPKELMNLMMASRHYQASVAIMKKNQEVTSTALELLK